MTWNREFRRKTSLFQIAQFVCAALILATTPPSLARGDDDLYVDLPSDAVSFSDSATASYDVVSDAFTPDDAYRILVAGNARYLRDDKAAARSLPKAANANGDYPIATVVYSPDMPILPTTLTQTTSRDAYLAPIDAGAVASEDLVAIEYGLVNLQTPLLVVLGHYPSRTVSTMIRDYDVLKARSEAEAKKLALQGSGTLTSRNVSEQMKRYNLVGPAIARSKAAYPNLQGYQLANVVSEALVWQSLETILMKSTTAQDLARAGKISVIAAIADDETGKIYWLGEHPMQAEFLKPTPKEYVAAQPSDEIVLESDLPAPLSDADILAYEQAYEDDAYYNGVVYEYYSDYAYYQPSWELFSRRAWVYRPWYGVWIDPFVPWPYYQPWGYPYGESSLGVSFGDGRLNFFIGYNRFYGAPIYYDPHFRPRDSWWAGERYATFDPHRHDPVFDLIIGGRRSEIPHRGDPAPWRRSGPMPPPPGYRPGGVRPGASAAISFSLGGLKIAIGGSDRKDGPGGPIGPGGPDFRRNPGARPDNPMPGARPGNPMPGARPGNPMPGARPGNPMPGARPGNPMPGARPGNPMPGARPGNPMPGARPGNPTPGARPSNPTPDARPDNPTPGARPSNPTPGARPSNPTPGARPSNPMPGVRPGNPMPGVRPGNPMPGARPGNPMPGARPSNPTSDGTSAARRRDIESQANVARPSARNVVNNVHQGTVNNRPTTRPRPNISSTEKVATIIKPNVSEHSVLKPAIERLNPSRPDSPRPNVVGTNPIRSEPARPNVARPTSSRTDSMRPNLPGPNSMRPEPPRPNFPGSNSARLESARPIVARPNQMRPESARPNFPGSNSMGPESARSNHARPEGGRPTPSSRRH